MENPPSPYVDVAGRSRLRQSVVAFIDILGFSHVATSSPTFEDSQKVLDRIVAAIHDSREFVRQSFQDAGVAKAGNWAIKFFSDNLAVGHPLDGPPSETEATVRFLIQCAQQYELRMALNGYFLRGALTVGPLCLTDEIIFGSALIECYKLETNAAIVPRVIVTEPLQKLVKAASMPAVRDSICRDVDGWWFLNYLEAAREGTGINWDFIARHKESILASLSTTTRHDVLPKFGWACRYHNVFCHWHRDTPGYADRYRVARADEHSTIVRPSDEDRT